MTFESDSEGAGADVGRRVEDVCEAEAVPRSRRKVPAFAMLVPVLALAAFAGAALVGMRQSSDELPSTRVGRPAPPIEAEALPGFPPVTPQLLASGEVTLVNFWASWCPPCRAEHPRLLELQAQGVPIVGVNFKDEATDAIRYLEDHESPFVAVAYDRPGRAAIEWGVIAPPETFILDGQGQVLHRFTGPLVGTAYRDRFVPAFERASVDSDG